MTIRITTALIGTTALVLGCASLPSPQELDAQSAAMHKAAFRDQGIAKVDRIVQDLGQKACSSPDAPAEAVAKQIESESLATIKWPTGGVYLGSWQEGEKLAQTGRGMTWTDRSADPKSNGAQCYNCHQLSKEEISFGTIGPSLYHYGKQRGVKDPLAPESAATLQYTWGKLWNSKAYAACSNMPRFGHMKLLNEEQIRDVMALLLDPQSPVNR